MRYNTTKNKLHKLTNKYTKHLNELLKKLKKKPLKKQRLNLYEKPIVYESDFELPYVLHERNRKDIFVNLVTDAPLDFQYAEKYVEIFYYPEGSYGRVLLNTYNRREYDIYNKRGSHNTEDMIDVYIFNKDFEYTFYNIPETLIDYVETAIVLDKEVDFPNSEIVTPEGLSIQSIPTFQIKQTEAQEELGFVDLIVRDGFSKVVNTLDSPDWIPTDFKVKMIVSLINPF